MKEIIIHIPVNDNEGIIQPAQAVALFENLLINKAGGFTKQKAYGCWQDELGGIYREDIVRYIVACNDKARDSILYRLPDFCFIFQQKCIYVILDGEMNLIENRD